MAKTTIPSELIADNAVGITQLNVSDGSNGQALVTNGSGTLSFASVGVSGISSSADATAITIDSSEDVTFSGGIYLGGTGSANKLTDYEEGTFTPTFGSATLSTADGSYTKIGNQVTVHFRVITSGGLPTSSSQVQVGGLPFTAATGFGGVGGLYVGPSNVSSATGGGGTIIPYITGGEDFIRFLNVDTGTFGYTTWGELEVSHNNVVTAIGTQTYQV